MKKNKLSFEDLEAYQELCKLHMEIHELTFQFPEIEMHEIGYQLRKLSNSAPASIAEGYSNKHVNFYIQSINRALGEVRQTKHYLNIAFKKKYIDQTKYLELIGQYDECERMLKSLEKSINSYKSKYNTFTKNQFRDTYYP